MHEVWTVVGFYTYEFKPDDSDVTYKCTRIYCVGDDITGGNFVGAKAESFKVPGRVGYEPMLGDRVHICFNQYGKLVDVIYAK